MMNPFVSCLVYGLDALIYDTFFSRIRERRYPWWISFLLGLPLFQMVSLGNLLLQNNIWINTVAMVAASVVYVCLCFHATGKAALCYSLLLTALAFGLEMIAVVCISLWVNVDITEYNESLFILFVEFLACKAPFFLLTLILANRVSKPSITKMPLSLFAYPIAAVICLFVFWYICLMYGSDRTLQALIAFASGILFLSTIFLFTAFHHEAQKNGEWIRIQGENLQLKMERDYYRILERQNESLMGFAHDANKHLAAIQELNQDPGIAEYVAMLSGQLKSYTKTSHSGNKLLDVMISRYQLDSRDVRLEYEVRTCNLSGVADLDLVAILGNLMDNAMAAAQQSKARYVSLKTGYRNGYSVITLENSCDTPPMAQGKTLLSTKENARFHGHGLKNVAKALKKYQGDFYWAYNGEAHTFTVTVMIKEDRNTPAAGADEKENS